MTRTADVIVRPEAVLNLLAEHINLKRWGTTRARLVAALLGLQADAEDGIARCGWRRLAGLAGVSPRFTRVLLGGMLACHPEGGGLLWRVEMVVARGQPPRGGRVGTAMQVTPTLELWRRIPWLEADPARRCEQVQPLRAAIIAASQGRARSSSDPSQGRARPLPAAGQGRARPPAAVAQGRARPPECGPARAPGAVVEGVARAPGSPSDTAARAPGSPSDTAARAPGSLSEPAPLPHVGGFKSLNDRQTDDGVGTFEAVKAAALKRSGIETLFGRPEQELRVVVAEIGADEALRRAERLPGPVNGRSLVKPPGLAAALRSMPPTPPPLAVVAPVEEETGPRVTLDQVRSWRDAFTRSPATPARDVPIGCGSTPGPAGDGPCGTRVGELAASFAAAAAGGAGQERGLPESWPRDGLYHDGLTETMTDPGGCQEFAIPAVACETGSCPATPGGLTEVDG